MLPRGALAIAAAVALVGCSGGVQVARAKRAAPIAAATDLAPREQALHVLNRLAFGPRPGDVDEVLRTGVDRWIRLQLTPDRIPDRAGERALAAYEHLGKDAAELRAEFPPPGALRRLAGGQLT